ncbi:MAG: DNA polymerase III subunit delta [Ligilactobacillus ruminis]|nr:DNA polymerase III subunit delta [Ligilactobacillus ruminis]
MQELTRQIIKQGYFAKNNKGSDKLSTVAEVMNQIKNDKIGSIYLILGKERYCSEEIKNALLGKLSPQEKEFNSSIYDMEETPLASALNDAMSVPFFGDRRIVIVNNPYFLTGEKKKNKVEHDIDGLLKYLEYPLETTTLVFIAPYEKLDERKKVVKTLKKVANVVENQPLKEIQVRQIINQRLKKNGLSIEPKAFDTLMERTNAEISLAMNELDKLILLCKDEQVISEAEADRMISRSLEQNVFDLVSLVLSRNTQKSIEMYHDLLLSKEEPIAINAILIGQFRLLLQVSILKRHGFSQGSITNALKIHPYRVKLALRTVQRFQQEDLKNAYLGLVKVEKRLKSTDQDPELLFQLFMLQFCQHAA